MSPTDERDEHAKLADDAVDRALRADAEQWRASHRAPSLDDAVRRLDDHGAAGRTGWWRVVAVAAAVLVLLGGAVGVLGRRTQPHGAATPMSNPARPSTAGNESPTTPLAASGAATLTRPPDGFVERRPSDRPPVAGNPTGPGADPVAIRYWAGPHPGESLLLLVGSGTAPTPPGGETVTVRGHRAQLEDIVCASLPSACTSTTVSWNEGAGQYVMVVYGGPGRDSPDGPGLSRAAVLAAAGSYTPGGPG